MKRQLIEAMKNAEDVILSTVKADSEKKLEITQRN